MFGSKPGAKLKIRVWVERNGARILGPGRIELMGHIDRLRSISAAAKEMGMSYRRAWSLVQSINDAAGQPLVEVTTGGLHGGGAALTRHGKAATREYEMLVRRVTLSASHFLQSQSRK